MTWQVILPPRKLKKSFWVKNIFKKSTALRCFFITVFYISLNIWAFLRAGLNETVSATETQTAISPFIRDMMPFCMATA